MKNRFFKVIIALFLVANLNAQEENKISSNSNKLSMAVLNFESVGVSPTSTQLGAMIRLEVAKLNKFVVVEKHDMIEALNENQINLDDCYSTNCMRTAGKAMNADQVLTGTIENFGSKLVFNFKLFDMKKDQLIRSVAYEYIYEPNDIEKMAKVSVQKLMEIEVDKDMDEIYNYESYEKRDLINSDLKRVNLSGPRFGIVSILGESSNFLTDPASRGGLGSSFPFMTQIGFQFEKAYLNAGTAQALFEVIPMFTGMDKGFLNPSLSMLNGFRSNANGWEIGFGPSFRITKESKGYLDANNQWLSRRDARYDPDFANQNEDLLFYRMDKRGNTYLRTSWLVSVGKTFKSGTLNVPVNLFVNFAGNDTFAGISLGYNISK